MTVPASVTVPERCRNSGTASSAPHLAIVTHLETPLTWAATWVRVLHGLVQPRGWKPESREEIDARREIVRLALDAVNAWGSSDMKRAARKDAKKARQICDMADDFAGPDPRVVDLAAYRARKAGAA